MSTWVIVKTQIDSSLNLCEHCVCDNENNCCPAGPALRGANPAGQPCGAAYPAYPAFDLRCTPLFEVLKHLESGVQPVFVSKDGQRQCARRLGTSTNVPQRQNKRFLAYFGVFWLHLAARGPTGQLWAQNWGAPSEPTTSPGHFRWVSNSQGGGLIQYLGGGAYSVPKGGLFGAFRPF